MIEGQTERQSKLDMSPILYSDDLIKSKPQYCQVARNEPFDQGLLAERIVADVTAAIEGKTGGSWDYTITNCDRSIGARVSGEIAKRHGNLGMEAAPIRLNFIGVAGQSFGVWNAGGLEMYPEGDANDYVGKGMAGGKLVIRPPRNQFCCP